MDVFALGLKLKEEGAATVNAALAGVKKSVKGVGAETDATGRKTSAFFQSLKTGAGLAAGAVGIGALTVSIKDLVATADTMRLLEGRLKLVTASAQELDAIQQALIASSTRTRTSYESAVELYARTARAFEGLGRSQADVLRFTELTSMAIKSSGATATEANAAVIQLSQGLAAGQLRGEEFNSVMEQTPAVAQAIAQALGLTTGELRKLAFDGKLTSDVVVDSILKMDAAIRGDFALAPVTVSDAFVLLRNTLMQTIGEVDKATGASAALARGIIGAGRAVAVLGDVLVTLGKALDYALPLAIGLGTAFAVSKWTLIVSSVGAAVNVVVSLTRALNLAAIAQGALNVVMNANPALLLASAVGALTAALFAYNTAQNNAIDARDRESANNPAYLAALESIRKRREAATAAEQAAAKALADTQAAMASRVEDLTKLAGMTRLTRAQTNELRLAAAGYAAALRVGNLPLSQRITLMEQLRAITAAVAQQEAIATSAARARAEVDREVANRGATRIGSTITGPIDASAVKLSLPDPKPLVDAATAAAANLYLQIRETFSNAIGLSITDGIAAGFERGFATGKIGEGFKALAGTLLSGLGSAMIQFGQATLAASAIMAKIKAAFASLNPAASAAAAVALIALGGTLKGAAQSAFGGTGGARVTPVTAFGATTSGGLPTDGNVTRLIFGGTSATTAAGMQPRTATNVTIIGPDDPRAQRAIQELIAKGNSRGTLG